MVEVMDNDSVSEGLFLKNYLGTVSAVPRPRTVAHLDTKQSFAYGEYPKQKSVQSLQNGMLNHARIIYELEATNENETDSRKHQPSEIFTHKIINSNEGLEDVIQVENEEEKEKKKEKKWTLGGLFRRKSKKDADDSSDDSVEDTKKGFLSRRKSKRDRRKVKPRTNANGFDVVIPQTKEIVKNREISVEQLWSGDSKLSETSNGPVRYIHRHPDVSKANSSLQVPKHCRRDSNLSRSSGGSENAEGKKGRKEVMARAEAKRDMMRDDSSSDDCESYHSNSSLNRINTDCRRPRRPEKYKRLSKDEDLQGDLRVIKSDFEGGRRLPHSCRWISRAYYPDSSDHEPMKLNLINHSGTSSPCRSPRARQKQLLQYMMMQNSYPTSTFPPGVQQMRSGKPGLSPTPSYFPKENQPLVSYRNQGYRTNRSSEYNLPRSVSSSENSNRKTLMDYEQFLKSCGSGKEKSLSHDHNLHRASYFENEPEATQTISNLQTDSRRTNRPEMFTNSGRGVDNFNHSLQPAVKAYNGVAENRTDSTPSLQSGIFPQQPTQVVHRSPSGNSFCESSKNFHSNRSTSFQHIPANYGYSPRPEVPESKSLRDNIYKTVTSSLDSMTPKASSILRYYADQNPRSRNPIHITCNPTLPEQPYLSDSQVVMKPIQHVRNSASDFWKLKDQETLRQQKKSENSLKPPPTQSITKSDRSRSNSPRLKEGTITAPKFYEDGINNFENKFFDNNNKKILKEEYNAAKVNKSPPEPPIRRLSKQEVLARLKKCEQLKNQENEIRKNLKNNIKSHSSNLDEALNELEMIYNSLRLKDEDLVERAERRDLPVFRAKNPIASVSVRDKIQNFYAETDYLNSKNLDSTNMNGHQRAIPLRRSGVPDKTTDDMAFRRMNQKERTDVKKLPSQSYLRSSPALSPVQNVSPTFRKESPVLEPDITYDDVVFRNIRHANSTLKIQDPQPPFGIPIGVIAPAPNSDYLHATPTERFRPTFTSSKTPDVVKDDLAFRNLRKDRIVAPLEPNKSELKKRAVRSLSANLYNIMQKNNSGFEAEETKSNIIFDKNCEKTQSLTDLTKGKQALERRLKELKEEKNAMRAEFFELSQEARKKSPGNLSWTDLADLNGNFEAVSETKIQKTTFPSEEGSKKFRLPVVELSKYPAAAPSSSLQGNPFKKEPTFVDDDQLESLLSALAKEAENASKDLERQLDQLETKKAIKTTDADPDGEKLKARAIQEFDKKFKSLDKTKRRRNLSLSNSYEVKEEIRKTGSLERRKKTDKCAFSFEELLRGKTNETEVGRRTTDSKEVTKTLALKPERKLSKSDSTSSLGGRERKQSQSFEVVTDLSQILHDVETEQHLRNEISHKETNSVFQEVYEYNCKLPTPEIRRSRGGEEFIQETKETLRSSDTTSDLETEFEKLHEEVNSTKETKETDFALVNDLMASITSVDQSPSDSYSSFPFPNDGETPSSNGAFRHRDGTSPGSSKGEETSTYPNGSATKSDEATGISKKKSELEVTMFPKDKEPKNMSPSNSSSESDQKREWMEQCKDARRRQPSTKYPPGHDPSTKSFKTTRKKEDLRGGGSCGPFLSSYLNSQCPDNQVPSSDPRRFSSRRDGNKTDSASGNGEEPGSGARYDVAGPKEVVLVRETKASRLRAASRASGSEKSSISSSPTFSSNTRKDIDKSLSRKSHLNRSHTSEGVYDDVYVPGDSNVRRRRSKNLSLESSPAKTTIEKSVFPRPTMGNANGTAREPQLTYNQLLQTNPLTKSALNSCQKPTGLLEKCSLKPNPSKKRVDESDFLKAQARRSPEHRLDKSKQIDIATRAEILAASTLKMINRLDEINNKTRKTQDDFHKKSLPLNSVINGENSGINFRAESKKVPSPDENTAKGFPNRIRLRADKASPKKSLEEKKTDVKPSILKNKPFVTSAFGADAQKPVSILKRKSLSQDDSQSNSPPVTFSPSVLKKETDVKRQGILKKRRSLDENEVLRRRSHSPDASYDFKSILKSQRRSSMEELRRRSHSPDSTPQSILKRKSSKEEETEDERQGILKRKSMLCLSSNQHAKITETDIAGASDTTSESVRPILKKKSSSEDHSASDPSLTEVPKSILKKKTSLEVEETEDKPMKPILKSSRMPSVEEPEEGKKNRSLIFNAFDERKPILKRENSKSGETENEVVMRRVVDKLERPHSSSDIDSELSAIFLKRRSLEFQPVSAINFALESQRTKRASSNERLRGDPFRRPLSVAEKINNLENFLEVERIERERRNSPPGTPPADLGNVKKSENQKATSSYSKEGSRLDLGHDVKSSSFAGRTDEGTSSDVIVSLSRFPSLISHDANEVDSTSSSNVKSQTSLRSRKSSFDAREEGNTNQLYRKTSFHSTDSEQIYSGSPSIESDTKYDTDTFYSLGTCQEEISSLSLKDLPVKNSEPFMDAEDLFLLQKSGSVSAKASLFKEIEKKCKADAEKEKLKKSSDEDVGINRRQEKKLLESNVQRYHTQPVSTEEVKLAVRKSKSNVEGKNSDCENHEDELCTMSYKERLRLFESTFTPKFPEPTPKKRGARYRTQPVTTDEVETAKSQRPSSSVATESTGEGSSGLTGLKENIYNRSSSRTAEDKSKPKGILKNLNPSNESKNSNSDSDSSDNEKRKFLGDELNESFQNMKKVLKKVEKETSSDLKGILKQPSVEKKNGSSSEEENPMEYNETTLKSRNLGANLAAILQKVEPLGRSSGKDASEEKDIKAVPKYMQNAGIARIINRSRNSSLIVKSQSHSSVSSVLKTPPKCVFPENRLPFNGESTRKIGKMPGDFPSNDETDDGPTTPNCLRRSTTQPLAPSDEGTDDDLSGASIQERLARLKKSGELDWQKRKSHATNLGDELSVITAGNYLFNESCLLREKTSSLASQHCKESEELRSSSSILADRLGKLDAAKEGWKKRIKPSDAVQFSVEGKMLEKRESLSPPNSSFLNFPTKTFLTDRKKRIPKAARFKSKQCNPSLNSAPSSPLEKLNNPISRSVSAPGSGKDGLFHLSAFKDLKESTGPVVTVPKNDDETFTSFFDRLSTERVFQERLDIKDEDLDAVTRMKSSQLLVQKRNIKTQKRRATVKNPVKALAARLDLQEYTEVRTGVAEKELKRLKIEKAAKNSTMAIEALAGLASQEDFTAINLKKATEGTINFPDAPYKDLMLLQVKGRRHVQTRLIEPVAQNVNSGDCFILVTPNRIFHYVGEFANVIEKSRAAEISLHIQQKGDLGCTASSVITIGEGGRATKEQVKEFWDLLGGKPDALAQIGNLDEDELFETALVDTNMIYEVVSDELVPVEAYWGCIPKIEILNPNKILVFDFGSELYVWNGKNVSLPERRVALKLAKEFWEEGFDYTECDLCPLTAASFVGGQTSWSEIPVSAKAGPSRPGWALFAKITQNMETVLFREKFLDWPDYARIIRRGKDDDNEEFDSNGTLNVKPCDAKKMLENVIPEPDLVLEGNHLGRGVRYFDEETRRCSEIATQDVTVWHVNEFEYSKIPTASIGQFHMEDSYVVRWHYVITITGRELSGQPSKHLTAGRNRYAYFFWQGQDSPLNDKGAAACLTVELDKEHGPQVRVVQGYEPPAFLNLFEGGMVVHRGRRCSETSREKYRLFICRGQVESESVLFEVSCSMRQLRSLASFILINKDTGKIIVWHGWKSPEKTRKIALNSAKRLQSETPEFEFKTKELAIKEELEGSESQDFIRALGGDNRQLYNCLLQDKVELKTPRLFHLTSVSGEFLFNEVVPPYLTKDSATSLPFLQGDLYSASQPALFLLDSSFGLWLWQGWWEDSMESERGSSYIRFQAERRAAMMTAMTYWDLKYGKSTPKAYLIWAGLEPLVFTNQFPFWTDRDDIAEINMKDGRKPGEAVPIKNELSSLTQSTYPLAQLQNRPLPDGVNPTSLEDYLEPQCFLDLFGMEKKEFLNLPSWKKKKLKQDFGLF